MNQNNRGEASPAVSSVSSSIGSSSPLISGGSNENESKGVQCWQLCPGSINPYHQAFSWTMHMGDEMIAFASGKYTMVYCGTNFLQLLEGHDDMITCVKWSNLHGRLATCSRGKIIIYAPIGEDDSGEHYLPNKKPVWGVEQTINTGDVEFDCMDWNLYGDRLIVGGKFTMIWEGKPVIGQIYVGSQVFFTNTNLEMEHDLEI